jgi:hypothetical protein
LLSLFLSSSAVDAAGCIGFDKVKALITIVKARVIAKINVPIVDFANNMCCRLVEVYKKIQLGLLNGVKESERRTKNLHAVLIILLLLHQ